MIYSAETQFGPVVLGRNWGLLLEMFNSASLLLNLSTGLGAVHKLENFPLLCVLGLVVYHVVVDRELHH